MTSASSKVTLVDRTTGTTVAGDAHDLASAALRGAGRVAGGLASDVWGLVKAGARPLVEVLRSSDRCRT